MGFRAPEGRSESATLGLVFGETQHVLIAPPGLGFCLGAVSPRLTPWARVLPPHPGLGIPHSKPPYPPFMNPGFRGARRPPLRQAGRPPLRRDGSWVGPTARNIPAWGNAPGERFPRNARAEGPYHPLWVGTGGVGRGSSPDGAGLQPFPEFGSALLGLRPRLEWSGPLARGKPADGSRSMGRSVSKFTTRIGPMNRGFQGARRPPLRQAGGPPLRTHGA
jgi:hypothetical protein